MTGSSISIEISKNKIRLLYKDGTGQVQKYLSELFFSCKNCLDTCDIKVNPTYFSLPWGRIWSKNRVEFWLPHSSKDITDEFINKAILCILDPLELADATEELPKYSIKNLHSREYVTAFSDTKISSEKLLLCIESFIKFTDSIRREIKDCRPDTIHHSIVTSEPAQYKGPGMFIQGTASGFSSQASTATLKK